MARSAEPERVYIARRMGLVVRLSRLGKLSPETAERWVAQWETEADFRGLDRHTASFWEPAWDWISGRRGR